MTIVLGVLAAAVVVILLIAASKPDRFRVERRVAIAASPEKVFPWLEDPRRTIEWSPWEKKDPNIKKTFGGTPKGVGAVYEWSGNKEVGSGRLEIVKVQPGARVTMDLHFLAPMENRCVAEYAVAPTPAGCEVAWTIEGPSAFMSKVFCVFMDMDKMIGGEFEKGLADLKRLAEK